MVRGIYLFTVPFWLATSASGLGSSNNLLHLGPQGVNFWQLENKAKNNAATYGSNSRLMSQTPLMAAQQDGGIETQKGRLKKKYPAHRFTQPLDHFDKTVKDTWEQRYWIDDRFYKPGGPVFVLDGGETSGEDRIPYLDHGILTLLSNATGGLSVVLEHRYYGESLPVSNFSTDALRWLNNAQALQDSARFMSKVKFPGIDADLTAPGTPWIYYGGSYAGARAAHMRVLYPDLVFGAIASSAVTHAAIDYSDYFEVIRRTNNQTCVGHIESAIKAIDRILDTPFMSKPLKTLFGLAELQHDDDFASVLTYPLGAVQATNWDSNVSETTWSRFCEAISAGGAASHIGGVRIPAEVINYAKWVREEIVPLCPENSSVEECFGTYDDSKYQDISDLSSWRAWSFQVCTEWGYFMPAPGDPEQRSLLSRRITLDYTAKGCKQFFPPGAHYSIPLWPNVTSVNSLGDYGIAKDRLAFIDGDRDPWIAATPHSWHAPEREDTVTRPFKIIPSGVHHWDENSLTDNNLEPVFIGKIHSAEVNFVREWLRTRFGE
ncbi:hypothetical protein FRC03_010443 [Tulasnella sp. 419]|nr:hypothetical protein FRC03_010443 [Tulasnella sp. 419]